jgi:hypothetical protein
MRTGQVTIRYSSSTGTVISPSSTQTLCSGGPRGGDVEMLQGKGLAVNEAQGGVIKLLQSNGLAVSEAQHICSLVIH